jgi:threonylcarbamoyladenosine tRNA methylthiotransferase MtaB
MMKKYQIVTLGCRTNQYESQLFSDQLRKVGYVQAVDEEADLCIINTCSVTDHADSSSRAQIRKLARQHPQARLVVTGCMAQSAKESLLAIDERIEVLPNQNKNQLISFLFPDVPNCTVGSGGIERFDGHTRAFVKVQDGCNSFCSYCIIPFTRGRSLSRGIAEIISEVQTLIANGFREIVLTGVNLGDYEADGMSLADLVREIDPLEGLVRLRLSSIDPTHVDEKLAEILLNGRCTCPNLHLVLQSGSDAILKRMNRKYNRSNYLQTVERLVQFNPDFTFTTDIIVGFPGESDADFAETLELVRQIKFAKVHIFPYSVRSGTRAAHYEGILTSAVIHQRRDELHRLADKTAFEMRESFLNRTMDVLLENGEQGVLTGHTANFLSVEVPRGTHRPNEVVPVKLLENLITGFKGKIV